MNCFKISVLLILLFQVIINPDYLIAASFSESSALPVNAEKVVFDEFELLGGIEVGDINFWDEWINGSYDRRRVIQLKEGAASGSAEADFFEPSAKYDITLHYVEGKRPDSKVTLLINNKKIGTVDYGSSYAFKEKTFENINVQKWSRITLNFQGEKDAKCRVEKLILTPVGRFDNNVSNLEKPVTLKIFETFSEVQKGRRVFYDFIMDRVEKANQERTQELMDTKNTKVEAPVGARWQDSGTDRWKKKQDEVRKNLNKYFGEFPEKTPLNAKITGKLEYDKYTIEKIIFESEPGYFITANLYVPKGRELPLPAVVFPLGHSDAGKSRDNYHMSGLGLVLKGYVVLIYDPIGQGERSEYVSDSRDWLVHLGVDQHWYVGRPAFLANWTLSGLRTWDGIRAVDYLVSRSEVDTTKLAAVGCSGGGQMALLITAVDQRIKVCAASHPGGPMENAYLTGKKLSDKEIYSLIPPRPLRIIVGIESGEEPRHREYLEDMQYFYEGLHVGRQTAQIDMVPGPHSMNRSNRESAYEWLNKWFDKEAEGKAEAKLNVEKEEDLWCTKSGNTIQSLGSRTGQDVNAMRAGNIYEPAKDKDILRKNIASRIKLSLSGNRELPVNKSYELLNIDDLTVEKLTYESEKGIIVPALLIKPKKIKPDSPVFFYVSEKGKPVGYRNSNVPFLLAKEGFVVFAADVRGTGETSPIPSFATNKYTGHTPYLRILDDLSIHCLEFGQTTLGMRAYDILRGIDYLHYRNDLNNKQILTIGEGLGGVWSLVAAAFDNRIAGTVTIGTLPSYLPLLESKYYNNVWGYFWVPGALKDFDIPDLARLSSSKIQLWINPINELGEPGISQAKNYLNQDENLKIIQSAGDSYNSIAESIIKSLK